MKKIAANRNYKLEKRAGPGEGEHVSAAQQGAAQQGAAQQKPAPQIALGASAVPSADTFENEVLRLASATGRAGHPMSKLFYVLSAVTTAVVLAVDSSENEDPELFKRYLKGIGTTLSKYSQYLA